MYDAIVVGAGPAGSFTALKLAERGFRVLVLEKKADAGLETCCTGIVGKECLELLGGADELIRNRSSSARFFLPSGRNLSISRDETVAYVIDRAALDRLVKNRAMAAGAEYCFSALVSAVTVGDSGVAVHCQRQGRSIEHEAKTLVISTGYSSNLPARLGLGKISDFLIGNQAEVCTLGSGEVEIYVDQRLTPGGFAWLVPTQEGRGLAGLLSRQQADARLTLFLEKLVAQGKIRDAGGARCSGAIPIRGLPRTYSDRLLVVGDAAGQVKPTTGGGIYYGLLCAEIAATVLAGALELEDCSAARLSSYERLWKQVLKTELTVGYWAHRLWKGLDNEGIESLFSLAASRGVPKLIATSRKFSFDWHSPLLLQVVNALPGSPAPLEHTLSSN